MSIPFDVFHGHRPGFIACFSVVLLTVSLLAFQTQSAFAANDIEDTISSAASRYGIDPDVLLAIAKVESGMNPVAEGDHGHSHGLFQINDYWLHRFHIPRGAMLNPIINAQWGAYVLSQCFHRYPGNHQFWRAVGCYNTGASQTSDKLRSRYAWRVYKALHKIKQNR